MVSQYKTYLSSPPNVGWAFWIYAITLLPLLLVALIHANVTHLGFDRIYELDGRLVEHTLDLSRFNNYFCAFVLCPFYLLELMIGYYYSRLSIGHGCGQSDVSLIGTSGILPTGA